MSGIPLQRRTEYCFYVKISRDPLQDAFLYFSPVRDAHKYDISRLCVLSDVGRWWYAYEKLSWDETRETPDRFVVLFGAEEDVNIRIRRLFKKWRDLCLIPLKISPSPPISIQPCTECDGSGRTVSRDDPDMPFEDLCKVCKGMGKMETPIKKARFDFIDESALDIVKGTKTADEYDRFLTRLDEEKRQRVLKRKR